MTIGPVTNTRKKVYQSLVSIRSRSTAMLKKYFDNNWQVYFKRSIFFILGAFCYQITESYQSEQTKNEQID